MALVEKNDLNQIFAANAPDQDKPPSFNNYTNGWSESRTNNGKPTIKQLNFIQQRTDQNLLWIHQNGGALPYDESIEYADGSIVVKDGELSKLSKGLWSIYSNKSSVKSINIDELDSEEKLIGKTVYVIGYGSYVYNGERWVRDSTFHEYDFKTAQPLQYYYEKIGNWDDAIEMAQLNMFTKGYSPRMIFPNGEVIIKRPIYGCAALGMYLHQKYPNLGIYNSVNNTFLAYPPLIIEGQGRDATTITFAGGKGRGVPDDLTWINYGAIHTAPYDVLEQCSGKATKFYHENYWTRSNLSGFTLYGYNKDTNGDRPNCHGIVLFRGNRGFINDVVVNSFNGSGLVCDGYYDSFFEKFEIFQCGRMSPIYGEYKTKDLTTIDYQTYAPLHIMNSNIGDGWDNCNFLRFLNFHIEDCHDAVADIIVTGRSSPIWIENMHFESDNEAGIANLNTKAVIAIGSYGVTRFAQDGISNYVYGSEEFTGNGGGYVYWNGGSGYSWTYGVGVIIGQYSQLSLDNLDFPNGLNINLYGINAPAAFKATKCVLGDINNLANAAQIVMTDCKAVNYTQNYGVPPIMQNVILSGSLKIENTISNPREMLILDSVNCDYAAGTVDWGRVDLVSTSQTTGTTLFVYNGKCDIHDNYVVSNLGGF